MQKNNRGWKVALVGECMLTRHICACSEPEFSKLREVISDVDVCCGHVEMNYGQSENLCSSSARIDKQYLLAEPELTNELSWFGINMVSLAGEHSFDFGTDGITSTMSAVKNAGLISAGTGRDLDEAREAEYYEGDFGRVAMISTSSGNTSNEWSNMSRGNMRTRAGVNPLRVKTCYTVPGDAANTLREMAKKLTVLREYKKGAPSRDLEEGEFRIMLPSEQSTHGAAGTVSVFKEGDHYGVNSYCHKGDLEGNVASIKEAAKMSDYVIVSHNFSIADDIQGDVPPAFAMEFAHAAIDAGADVYFGHGWHKTLGVEIYKGKPIFYGLGNFIAQAPFAKFVPQDACENGKYGGTNPSDFDMPNVDLRSIRCCGQTFMDLTSVLVELEYNPDKSIKRICFYPIELGLDTQKTDTPINRYTGEFAEGCPQLAGGICGYKILRRIQDLSKKYNTHVEISDGVGYWQMEE